MVSVRLSSLVLTSPLVGALLLCACGGGGGSSPSPTPTLSYPSERLEGAVGVPFAPVAPALANVPVGALFEVTPALPAGLTLDPATGVLSGTPTALAAAEVYSVRAAGRTAPFTLRVSAPARYLFSGSGSEGTLLVQGLDAEVGATKTQDLLDPPAGLPPVTDVVAAAAAPVVAVAHGAAGVAGTLVVYDVTLATGALTERGRAALGRGPHRLWVTPDASAVYALDADDDTVRTFVLGSGAPTPLGAPLATGDGPGALTRIATGGTSDVLVVANRGGRSLSSFTVNPATHAITAGAATLALNGGVPSGISPGADGASVLVALENFSLSIVVEVAATGGLTAAFGGAQTGLVPTDLALHPAGALALVANQAEGSVTVLRRAAPGARPPLAVVGQVPVLGSPRRVTFDGAGRFAYVASPATGELTVLRYDPATVPHFSVALRTRLRPGAGAVAALDGVTPYRRALSTLYVIDEADDALTVLAPQGPSNEVLTSPVGPIATGSRSLGAALAPNGTHLFVVAEGPSQASVYALDSAGLPGSAVTSATPTAPIDIAAAPGGRIVVVASQSPPLVTSFAVDGSGALTEVDRQALPAPPGHIALDPVGRTVVVTAVSAGELVTLNLDADGALSNAVSSAAATGVPRSLAFSPDGRFVVTALENQDRLALYALDTAGGLTLVPPTAPGGASTGDRPFGVAVHPRGRFVLAAATAGGGTAGSVGSGAVDVFALEPVDGALSRVGGLAVGTGPTEVRIEPSGLVAYALNRTGRDLSILRFDPATGSLQSVGAVTLGNRPTRLVLRDVVQ